MSNKVYEKYSGDSRMFFGEGHGIQEFVDTPYPEFLKLKDQQRDLQWAHDEFPLSLDAAQLSSANQSIRHVFTSNLQSQIFADSVQGRGPGWLLPYCSDPSLEALLLEWSLTECLTPDHDVLTTEGWKSIDTITTNDKVAQYNPDTQAITFVNPSRTVSKPFKGNLIHFSSHNGYIDQLVTPNHRMPIMKPYSKDKKKAEAVLAKDVVLHGSVAIPNSGYIAGGVELTTLEQLYIAVQADGCLSGARYDGSRTGTLAYKFKFRKERKINRLLSIAQELEFNTRVYQTADNYTMIYVDIPLEFYRTDVKSFDWVDLSKVSSVWCEAFIEELTHWDGCRSSNMLRYTSSNKETVDFSCTIAHLAGFRAKVYVVPPTERWFPTESGERVLRQCGQGYQVTFTKRQYACGNALQKTEVPYDGMVYCLTVPDSAFMVRRNGKISLTFNCLHSRSYTQMLTAMYPNPKIVTDLIEEKPEIFNRFSQSLIAYDRFFDSPNEENLVLLIGAINILEGLAFYSSFACNFGFANMGMFESVAKYLALISRDECLTGDHEVLTDYGWIRIDQLRDGQKVAQFDPTNSNISFTIPSKIIKTTTDELITFKGDTVSQVVTPNHRMPVIDSNGSIDFKTPSGISNESGSLPVAGLKTGGVDVLSDEIKVLIPLKLYGYETDTSDVNETHILLLSDDKKISSYEDVLKASLVTYSKTPIEFPDPNKEGVTIAHTLFKVSIPASYTMNSLNINQFISDLDSFSSNFALAYLDYLAYWTGLSNDTGYVFNSSDKQFIDSLQVLGHFCGMHSLINTTSNGVSDYYSLQILKTIKAVDYSTINKSSETVDGDTSVYCLTVDTGAFLVRHNNQVSVTGNCLHVAFTQKIIKNWSSGKDGKVWKEAWFDNKDKIKDMYITGLHEETSWSKYLFKYGTPILGLNEKLLNDYNEYMSYKRMKNIGIKFDTSVTKDPLPWIQLKYGSQKNVANAPQEVKVIAYTKNPINKMEDLKDLKKLIL